MIMIHGWIVRDTARYPLTSLFNHFVCCSSTILRKFLLTYANINLYFLYNVTTNKIANTKHSQFFPSRSSLDHDMKGLRTLLFISLLSCTQALSADPCRGGFENLPVNDPSNCLFENLISLEWYKPEHGARLDDSCYSLEGGLALADAHPDTQGVLRTHLGLSWPEKGLQVEVYEETTDTSKQPIRTHYLGHVTGYQPIRDQHFLIRPEEKENLWQLN
eukprot:sb/3479528/